MRVGVRQVSKEREERPDHADECEAVPTFEIVVAPASDALRISLENVLSEVSGDSDSSIVRRYQQRAAVTKATPPFLVGTDGRFLGVADVERAVQDARAAMRSAAAMDNIETLVSSVDAEWVNQHAGQQWESWGHGVLGRWAKHGADTRDVKVALGASGAAVSAKMTTTLLGELECLQAPRCIAIATKVVPEAAAAIQELQRGLKKAGSPMLATSFVQERESVLEVDEGMIPRRLQSKWFTEFHLRLPEGHPTWSRTTIRQDTRFKLLAPKP